MKRSNPFEPRNLVLFNVILITLLIVLGLYLVQKRSTLTSPQDPVPLPTRTVSTAATITLTAASANVIATTPVATPTVRTPTPVPFGLWSTPTVNQTLLPPGGTQDFRLKRLTEQELVGLYEKARVDENILQYYGDSAFLQGSLLSEIFLRFPKRQADENLQRQWEMLTDSSYGSYFQNALIHKQSVEPLRQNMETVLNQQAVSLEGLQEWAKPRGAKIVQPVLESEQLFGDHSTAQILQVERGGIMWILVVRQKGPKYYTVTALYPRSFYLGNHKLSLQFLDLNGNGQDEIAVTIDNWGPGMAGWSQRTFELFEWDGKAFQNLISDPLSFNVWGRTNILDITTAIDENGKPFITAGTVQDTGCKGSFGYIEKWIYTWDGKRFKNTETRVLPVQENAPYNCALSWALIAGPEDDRAMEILGEFLESWPAVLYDARGPASQDFYRLVYGLWWFRLGDCEEGLRQFQMVRDDPSAPEYPWIGKLAGEFLNSYTTGGLIKAVDTFQSMLKTKLQLVDKDYLSKEDMILLEGFFAGDDEEITVPAVLFLDQFSPDLFLEQAVQEARISSQADMENWLKSTGLAYEVVQQGDVNGDGVEDWLVYITWNGDWWKEDKTTLYTFLREGSNIVPVLIVPYYIVRGGLQTWQAYRPVPGADLINLIQDGEYLLSFQVNKNEGAWQVVKNSIYYHTGSSKDDMHYPVGWSVEDGPAGKRLIINYDGSQGIYVWDSKQRTLVPTGYSPDLKEENIALAERYIYFDKTPARAVPILETLLSQNIWESFHFYGEGNANTPDIHPYVYYLLGFAYEQSRDEANAVRVYWQLWHDYPNQAYTFVARAKLEKVR